jgi:hypothetical protein
VAHRIAHRVAHRVSTEVRALTLPLWAAWRARGPAAFPVAIGSTALIGSFALLQHTSGGWWLVDHLAGVYQALPLWEILVRLPLSAFAPAPDLPAWGALLQVLLVFALAEIHLGPGRTVVTAVCVNALTTLSARVMILIGFQYLVGTPQVDAYVLDTGPSTIVVALCVYVALQVRTYLLMAVICGAMLGEAGVLPNLAGREHLVAMALGALAHLLDERLGGRGKQ